ncbi:MAG: SIMPL domain-containing protein [Thermomicrobiales bacterium]
MSAQPQVITVNGDATRPISADQATVLFLAEGTGETVGQAIRAHAEEVQRVVQALIGCGAPQDGIHGGAPRVMEENEPGLPSHAQRANTAARVGGTIRVVLNDLALLAQIVDAALNAGAAFGGITFGLRDETAARQITLAAALADARTTGEAIAATFGKPLSDALAIAEESVAFDEIGEYTARVRVTFMLMNV